MLDSGGARHLRERNHLNSLHIIQLIPWKSLWDIISLVSWGDKFFLYDELSLTGLRLSVQPNPFGAIKAYHSVPPISLKEKHLATCSCFTFDPAPLNESSSLQASQSYSLLCAESQGPNLFDGFQENLLGNWCQRGRDRSHQSLITYMVERERHHSFPRCLVFKEERCHMTSWGERHVHMCLSALVCISSVHLYLSALIFRSLSSSIPC